MNLSFPPLFVPGWHIDNDSTFIQFAEAVMLAIFLMGAAGGAWAIYRITRQVLHSIPRVNDDLIFF